MADCSKGITIELDGDTKSLSNALNFGGVMVEAKSHTNRIVCPEHGIVTGDGARWITDCVNEFTPDCVRCVEPFHVVEWAMDALIRISDALRDSTFRKSIVFEVKM